MDMDFFFLTRDDTTDADTVRTDSFVRISAAHNNTWPLFVLEDSTHSTPDYTVTCIIASHWAAEAILSVLVIADCGRSVWTTRPSIFLYPTNWQICSPCLERTDCIGCCLHRKCSDQLSYMYSTRLCEIIDSIRSRWCVVLFLSSLGR